MNRWTPLLLLALAAGCAGPGKTGADRHVIVISLDGFPAFMLEDPRLPIPTLRRLMAEGASAKGMTTVNPTVTWPNHTTLATGVSPAKHRVLYNGLLTAEPGKPAKVEQKNRSVLVKAPTVYDAAFEAGLTTAQVDWVPPQTGGTITWSFEENPDPNGVVEKEMVAAGLITAAELQEFRKTNVQWRDLMWTRAAAHIVKVHRPNLLFFHLLNLDATNHKYGPRTPASQSAMSLADARVAELLAAVDEAGLRERTTVLVVSDHGFKATKRSIRPNAALAKAGFAKVESGKVVSCQASVVPAGGTAMVYLHSPELEGKVRETLAALEGVDRVWTPVQDAALGYPDPRLEPQMAQFVLTAKPGYGFSGSADGEAVVDVAEGTYIGLHGYPAEDPDMDAIFIAWGRGIRKGARIETLKNVDVAPTIAALLGLKLEGIDGKAVSAILD